MILLPEERKILFTIDNMLKLGKTPKAPTKLNDAALRLLECKIIDVQGGRVVLTKRGWLAAAKERWVHGELNQRPGKYD